MLRGKPSPYWARVLGLLKEASLSKIRVQFPDYPYPDLFRSIQVSVESLDEQTRSRYLAVAVLLEEMVASYPILAAIWNTDEFGTVETAETLMPIQRVIYS